RHDGHGDGGDKRCCGDETGGGVRLGDVETSGGGSSDAALPSESVCGFRGAPDSSAILSRAPCEALGSVMFGSTDVGALQEETVKIKNIKDYDWRGERRLTRTPSSILTSVSWCPTPSHRSAWRQEGAWAAPRPSALEP